MFRSEDEQLIAFTSVSKQIVKLDVEIPGKHLHSRKISSHLSFGIFCPKTQKDSFTTSTSVVNSQISVLVITVKDFSR